MPVAILWSRALHEGAELTLAVHWLRMRRALAPRQAQAQRTDAAGSAQTPLSRLRLSSLEDVPQRRVGQICRKVTFCRTIVLRHLAALRPSTASDMKAIML